MSIWNNEKKVWCLGLIHNLLGKTQSSHLIQGVIQMKTKAVLKNVGAGENGAKVWVALKYSPTHLITILWIKHL
jgi:hypothetical protein